MMSDSFTEIEGVTVIRESGSGLAWLCSWKGTKAWVPKSQISADQDELEPGPIASLTVKSFIVDRWFEEPPEEYVSLGHATVMRESERAIRVRLKALDREAWIPKAVIADDSDVQVDPDQGDLKVIKNFAEREHLLADAPKPERSAGAEARSWGDGAQGDFDDDIPF